MVGNLSFFGFAGVVCFLYNMLAVFSMSSLVCIVLNKLAQHSSSGGPSLIVQL